MPPVFRNVLIGVMVFALIIYVLSGFGLINGLHWGGGGWGYRR
jgi:hypothetical protein